MTIKVRPNAIEQEEGPFIFPRVIAIDENEENQNFNGVYAEVTQLVPGTATIRGLSTLTRFNSTGSYQGANGLDFAVQVDQGLVNIVHGISSLIVVGEGAEVGDLRVLNATTPLVSGTVTTLEMLRIETPVGASENYAIRTRGGAIVFNEDGHDADVRMEGVGDPNLFLLDAANGLVNNERLAIHDYEDFEEVAEPDTPGSGYVRIYAKSDGNVYQKDDAGTETVLAGGGGGGTQSRSLPAGAWIPTSDESSWESAQLQTKQSSSGLPSPRWLEWLFDDTTDEFIVAAFIVPADFSDSPVLKVYYKAASATSGTAAFQARVQCVSDGDSQDVDADAFDTSNDATATVPGTAGHLDVMSISLANADGMAAGDWCVLALNRDVSADSVSGDLEVVGADFQYGA